MLKDSIWRYKYHTQFSTWGADWRRIGYYEIVSQYIPHRLGTRARPKRPFCCQIEAITLSSSVSAPIFPSLGKRARSFKYRLPLREILMVERARHFLVPETPCYYWCMALIKRNGSVLISHSARGWRKMMLVLFSVDASTLLFLNENTPRYATYSGEEPTAAS